MKKVLAVTAALLFLAQMAMPQGILFAVGGCYVSNYSTETTTTFQTSSRPVRVWTSNYSGLIRFDATDLGTINSPCTLYLANANNGQAAPAGQANLIPYLLKGTWQESSNAEDAVNLTGGVSWNYRAYPTGWGVPSGTGDMSSGIARKNSVNGVGGMTLTDMNTVVLDPVIVDSMKTGRFCGLLISPGAGAQYWLAHIGNYLAWGEDVAVEAPAKAANRMVLSASPNPFTSTAALNVSLRNSDKGATLAIYGLNGQKVADLSAKLTAGKTVKISWNAGALPNGVYVAKLSAGKLQAVKRLTLMK